MYRVVDNQAIFTVSAPKEGEYGLEIYANDPEVDGMSLFHAYQCLITCSGTVGTVESLPTLPQGFLGPQAAFKNIGLSEISHKDPYIKVDQSELEIEFGMTKPLRMTSQLMFVHGDRDRDMSEYILHQVRNALLYICYNISHRIQHCTKTLVYEH